MSLNSNWRHGKAGSPEYQAWTKAKLRAINESLPFENRWRNFKEFHKDTGDRPSSGHVLSRGVQNLGWVLGNVQWELRSQFNLRVRLESAGQRNQGSTRKCSVDGCPFIAKRYGLCQKHRAEASNNGTIPLFKPASDGAKAIWRYGRRLREVQKANQKWKSSFIVAAERKAGRPLLKHEIAIPHDGNFRNVNAENIKIMNRHSDAFVVIPCVHFKNCKNFCTVERKRGYARAICEHCLYTRKLRINTITLADAEVMSMRNDWSNGASALQIARHYKCSSTMITAILKGKRYADLPLTSSPDRRAVPQGELHPNSKLTARQVQHIKKSNLSARHLSTKYGVSATLVYNIRKGKTWGHVS